MANRQKDGSPPPCEPYDFRYQHGTSSVVMPNGSVMCVKQSAASHATARQAERFTRFQMLLTLGWAEAWAAEEPRKENAA